MGYDAIIFDLEGTLVDTVKDGNLLIGKENLLELAKKYKLSIATAEPRKSTEALLSKSDLIPEPFDPKEIVTLDDCSRKKPDPEPLLLAKKLISAKNPVYIGDTEKDRQAAESAKIPFVSVFDKDTCARMGVKFKDEK